MRLGSFQKRASLIVGAALATAAAGGTASHAATLAALQDGNKIVMIDADTKKVTGSVVIAGNATLVGFDVRPADGKLYGLTPDGVIVVIDAKSGTWEKKSQLSEQLPKGAMFTVDFNPVADRMRVLSSTGLSLRINIEDGKATVDGALKYAETDANKGKTPNVTAGSYTNSVAGTKETALYDIDATTGMLLKQAPPNDGILSSVGPLGIKISGPVAFDIWPDGKGGNAAWLLTGGNLYSVDLATGAAKTAGAIAGLTGSISDIAVMP
jgi:hypothetical protein